MVVNPDDNYPKNYGFGWDKGGEWYQHTGEDMGYITYIFMSFEKKITATMIKNIASPVIADANPWCPEYEIMDCVNDYYINNQLVQYIC